MNRVTALGRSGAPGGTLLTSATPRSGSGGPIVLLILASLVGAGVIGLAAAIFPPVIVAFLVAMMVGGVLVTRPVLLLWMTTLSTLVLAGAVKYFVSGFDRIWWVGYALAGSMAFAALLYLLSSHRERQQPRGQDGSVLLRVLLLLFLAQTVIAALAHTVPLVQFAAAAKSWLLYACVVVLFAVVPFRAETIRRWAIALLFIACVQVLPVVYQFVFVRGRRRELGIGAAAEAADSVVGTFGGSMEGGGLSAVLALFICVILAGVLLLRQSGVINRLHAFLLGMLLSIPLMLAEVKAAFLYVPISLLLVYRQAILRSPVGFLSGTVATGLLIAGALMAYQAFHWEKTGRDLTGNVQHFFGYSFEGQTSIQKYRLGIMTRREAVEFWWSQHGTHNPASTMFGHGFGSARTGGIALGTAAQPHWPRKIDMTGLSSLLWEFGVVGTALALGALVAGFALCGRLARSAALPPWQQALAGAVQVLMLLSVLSLPYRSDIPYAAPMMFMVMTGFGLTLWLARQSSSPTSRGSKTSGPV